MKYAIAVPIALSLFTACASTQDTGPKLGFELAQVSNPAANMYYFAGPVNVQFQLAITNPTNETYTLRRLELRTISPGAYALRTPSSPITATIAAGKTTVVSLSAWGRTTGSYLRAEEPVTIQATAYFDGPHGRFVKIFHQMLSQFGQ